MTPTNVRRNHCVALDRHRAVTRVFQKGAGINSLNEGRHETEAVILLVGRNIQLLV